MSFTAKLYCMHQIFRTLWTRLGLKLTASTSKNMETTATTSSIQAPTASPVSLPPCGVPHIHTGALVHFNPTVFTLHKILPPSEARFSIAILIESCHYIEGKLKLVSNGFHLCPELCLCGFTSCYALLVGEHDNLEAVSVEGLQFGYNFG